MKKQHGFIVGMKMNVMSKLLKVVFAEESQLENSGATTTPTEPPASQMINYEQLIANARKEEKEKLYPQITNLKAERDSLITKQNEYLIQLGTLQSTINDLKSQLASATTQTPSEKEASLQAELDKTLNELKELKENTVSEEELRASITSEIENKYKLVNFKNTEIAKAGGKLIPELVSGDTEEEVLASIEASKKRYCELTGQKFDDIPPANANTQLPTGNTGFDELVNLDPKSKEYATLRAKLGIK